MWTPENIRALRKHLGETIEEFGAHFGVGPETVRKWEKRADSGSPPSKTAIKVLQILHLHATGQFDADSVAGILELRQLATA